MSKEGCILHIVYSFSLSIRSLIEAFEIAILFTTKCTMEDARCIVPKKKVLMRAHSIRVVPVDNLWTTRQPTYQVQAIHRKKSRHQGNPPTRTLNRNPSTISGQAQLLSHTRRPGSFDSEDPLFCSSSCTTTAVPPFHSRVSSKSFPHELQLCNSFLTPCSRAICPVQATKYECCAD